MQLAKQLKITNFSFINTLCVGLNYIAVIDNKYVKYYLTFYIYS